MRVRALGLAALLLAGGAASLGAPARAGDWPMFGFDPSRRNAAPAGTGITAANVTRLRRRTVRLDGTVDSSPIYLHGVAIGGRRRDAIFVTTTYGRTEAIDAATGRVLWRYTPPSYAALAGTYRITNMTPVADPDRSAIYTGAPDGRIRKLRIADGRLLWSRSITRDPTHEKLTSSLAFTRGLVVATTGGYIGDAPPYQGHVVSLRPRTGGIVHVWNSLCSDRRALIEPSSCPSSDSAIWARSGAVVDPATGNLLVATGNGPWNGRTDWGDSVLVLSPDAGRLVGHWTPPNQAELERTDADLGSTAPALLDGGFLVQGGKDGELRLISRRLETVQTVPTPGGTDLFTAPAVWRGTWVFVASGSGTEAWRLRGGRLVKAWSNDRDGTSPVVAGGLLYVQGSGAIRVYLPASGRLVAELPCGEVHWQSPIVADGRVIAVEGNANEHRTDGVLDLYTAA
ncbi:MAG TPA: PQQ-binding-like beta-propeller repeat protein [Gaiellaceae bacterium]|nr:PQQ-binding-like beta-propeller repeat protein [Gaiellaceae bacterium]